MSSDPVYTPPANCLSPYGGYSYLGGGWNIGGGGGTGNADLALYLTLEDAAAAYAAISHVHNEYLTPADGNAAYALKSERITVSSGFGILVVPSGIDRNIQLRPPLDLSHNSVASPGVGTSGHQHVVTASPNPGTGAALLKTSPTGLLTLAALEVTNIAGVGALRTTSIVTPTTTEKIYIALANSFPIVVGDNAGVESANYSSSIGDVVGHGYRLGKIGGSPYASLEVDDVVVRRSISLPPDIVVSKIRGTYGDLFVTDAGIVSTSVGAAGSYRLSFEGVDDQFEVGDLIRARRFFPSAYTSEAHVTLVLAAVPGVSPRYVDVIVDNGSASPLPGYEYVRIGNTDALKVSRQGGMYFSNEGDGAPFLEVFAGVTSWALAADPASRRARMGRMTDIVGGAESFGFFAGTKPADISQAAYIAVTGATQEFVNIPIRMKDVFPVIGDRTTVELSPDYGLAMLGEVVGGDITKQSVSWRDVAWAGGGGVTGAELADLRYNPTLVRIEARPKLHVEGLLSASNTTGFNADTVDGLHANELVIALHTHPVYVNVNGSTPITASQRIKGDVNFSSDAQPWGIGESYNGFRIRVISGNTWQRGLYFYKAGTGVLAADALGFMGAYGASNAAPTWYGMGPDFDTNWLRVEAAVTTVGIAGAGMLDATIIKARSVLRFTGNAQITGNAGAGVGITVLYNNPAGDSYVNLGAVRTADGHSYINFQTESTDTGNYQARVWRYPGSNGSFVLVNSGTGQLLIQGDGGAAGVGGVQIMTSGIARLVINDQLMSSQLTITTQGSLLTDYSGKSIGVGQAYAGMRITAPVGNWARGLWVFNPSAAAGYAGFVGFNNVVGSFVIGSDYDTPWATFTPALATVPGGSFAATQVILAASSEFNPGIADLPGANFTAAGATVVGTGFTALGVFLDDGMALSIGSASAVYLAADSSTFTGEVKVYSATGSNAAGHLQLNYSYLIGSRHPPYILFNTYGTGLVANYVWATPTNTVRIAGSVPTSANQATHGTLVGPVASNIKAKKLLHKATSTLDAALASIKALLPSIKPFEYVTSGPTDEYFDGLILDNAHPETYRYGMDKNDDTPEGNILNAPTLFADIIKALAQIDQRLRQLEAGSPAASQPVRKRGGAAAAK